MTVNEYRRKYRQCSTCRYLIYRSDYKTWECTAKFKRFKKHPYYTRIGIFCRVYQPLEEAQEECTRLGIAVPCHCGGKAKIKYSHAPYFHWCVYIECEECHCRSAMMIYGDDGTINPEECTKEGEDKAKVRALGFWNTRAAPPIGRCETCTRNIPKVDDFGNPYILCGWHGIDMEKDGFCSDYKPKEADGNE